MLIALMGPHAIGKTTFVNHYYTGIDGMESVSADRRLASHPPPFTRETVRKLELKLVALDNAVASDDKLYLVEGCRFWAGKPSTYLAYLANEYSGGLCVIVVVGTPPFIFDSINVRRAKAKKEILNSVSDAASLVTTWNNYCIGRFHNKPYMPSHKFVIDSYDGWDEVKILIDEYIARTPDQWYS